MKKTLGLYGRKVMDLKKCISCWKNTLRHPLRSFQARREASRAVREKYSPENALFEIEDTSEREKWPHDDFVFFRKGGSILFIVCIGFRVGVVIAQCL